VRKESRCLFLKFSIPNKKRSDDHFSKQPFRFSSKTAFLDYISSPSRLPWKIFLNAYVILSWLIDSACLRRLSGKIPCSKYMYLIVIFPSCATVWPTIEILGINGPATGFSVFLRIHQLGYSLRFTG
jgi:hypothetical protein